MLEFLHTLWLFFPGDVSVINGVSVPNEMSSIPKSLPPATVTRSIIETTAVVADPEFQIP